MYDRALVRRGLLHKNVVKPFLRQIELRRQRVSIDQMSCKGEILGAVEARQAAPGTQGWRVPMEGSLGASRSSLARSFSWEEQYGHIGGQAGIRISGSFQFVQCITAGLLV